MQNFSWNLKNKLKLFIISFMIEYFRQQTINDVIASIEIINVSTENWSSAATAK